MKQTAVEWLFNQLEFDESVSMDNIEEIFNQAKEMEKEQIIQASCCGGDGESEAEIYYNEMFRND